MKKTDLERLKSSRIAGELARAGTPGRFGSEAVAVLSRREQRKADQARGLVPFACKLDGELLRRLQAAAADRGTDVNALVAELLAKGLAA